MIKKQLVEVTMQRFRSNDPTKANDDLYQINIRWQTGGATVIDNAGGNGYMLHNGQAMLIGWRNLFKEEVLS